MPGDDRRSRIRNEWFEFAEHDFETARLLSEQDGYVEIIVFHLHQAVEKYLKGYLIGLGWRLVKTHDLESIINEAASRNAELAEFVDFARTLSVAYEQTRYPTSKAVTLTRTDMAAQMEVARALITKVRNSIEHV